MTENRHDAEVVCRGIVKFYKDRQGYGFIEPDPTPGDPCPLDLFFHIHQWPQRDRMPEPGEPVQFRRGTNPHTGKVAAMSIRRI